MKKPRKRKASETEEDGGDDKPVKGAKDDNEICQWAENTFVKRIRTAKTVEIQFIAWNLLVSAGRVFPELSRHV